jgi:hypothetical protein
MWVLIVGFALSAIVQAVVGQGLGRHVLDDAHGVDRFPVNSGDGCTGGRTPALRFGDPRVMALTGALCHTLLAGPASPTRTFVS